MSRRDETVYSCNSKLIECLRRSESKMGIKGTILGLALEVSGMRANVANLDRKAIGSPNAMLIRSEAIYTAVRSALSGTNRSLTIEGCSQL